MASIRTRKGSNMLFVDFRYMNKRCRETTNLIDTPANRKKLEKVIEKMEAEITLGIFSYAKYFPKSDKCDEMMALSDRKDCLQSDVLSFKEFNLRCYGFLKKRSNGVILTNVRLKKLLICIYCLSSALSLFIS